MSKRLQTQTDQLSRLNDEIRRINNTLRNLRNIRKKQEKCLYETMRLYGIDKANGYTLSSLQKKYGTAAEKHRRSVDQKKEEARALCHKVGILDAGSFIKEFKNTQRTYE